jgi:hypothetical protein
MNSSFKDGYHVSGNILKYDNGSTEMTLDYPTALKWTPATKLFNAL